MKSITDLKRLRGNLAAAASYFVVSLGFYLLSLIVPTFVSGIEIPGVPDPIARLEWMLWAFLFLLSSIFAVTALYHLYRALDPFMVLVSSRWSKAAEPGKRVARDVAFGLLVVLTAAAVAPFVSILGSIGAIIRAALGITTLLLLVFFLYDAARTIYEYVRTKVDDLVGKVSG